MREIRVLLGDHDDPPASYHEFSLPNVKVDLCQDRFRGEVGRMMWYDFEYILAFSFIILYDMTMCLILPLLKRRRNIAHF